MQVIPIPLEDPERLRICLRYKGFILLQEENKTWLVRPERSPMKLLPFRTHRCSLSEVKAILNRRLLQINLNKEAA